MITSPVLEVSGDLREFVGALAVLRPDRPSCVVGYLTDGDYRVDVDPRGAETRIRMRVTLREDREAGGTWWTSRSFVVRPGSSGDGGESVGAAVADAVEHLRGDFARLLSRCECGLVPQRPSSTRNDSA